ncbi:P27 family phage terminase small subunit [Tepidanaerobacter syntrophicus]|uniref:P27 family phage terminase small subunit n=1 Tax=Tepidanaerobacter syntrophicus TaxID=224999 RepID=UPI00257B0D74|nr:P27 family phage terminase small subunit [Tepidanaerobacter sp. EBM-49]
MLGNLDIYILAQAAISIERLQSIETTINKDNSKMFDRNVLAAKEKYTKDFFRCCNELSLSPQSRAKLGNIALQTKQQQEDPLLKVLVGGKNAN